MFIMRDNYDRTISNWPRTPSSQTITLINRSSLQNSDFAIVFKEKLYMETTNLLARKEEKR